MKCISRITIFFPSIAPMLLGMFRLERKNSEISRDFSSLFGVLRCSSFNVSSVLVQTSMTISPMVVLPI